MSVAAHDLRNPIAVVRASAQMAQRQVGRGDTHGALARLRSIVEQTDRLTEMLEGFLDAARIGAGNLPLRAEQIDLRTLCEQAWEKARVVPGDEVERELELDMPEACVGNWDRARIVRAMRALFSNATLYGDASTPVRVGVTCDDNCARIVVDGGGPGPDKDELEHLFERFYRGRSAAEAGQSGSGLGLFTARGIARLHSGEVRHLGGDRFEMELPLRATSP
jgi:two-component system OmpR family sensor kinase